MIHKRKVSKNILLEGFNRFHSAPTSLIVQMLIKSQAQNTNNTNDPQKKYMPSKDKTCYFSCKKKKDTAQFAHLLNAQLIF